METPTEAYVIWSFEHDAWWRPQHMGYTHALAQAGYYTKAEAEAIVRKANQYLPRGTVHEIAIPWRDVRERPDDPTRSR